MTSYLAPESPRPFSVAAERYFQQLRRSGGLPPINININKTTSLPITTKCRFGEQYEREFCFYLAKHAEVHCNDRLCLVGDESDWASIIQERLFLIKPVHFINCNLHHDAIKEELPTNAFDRIILLNCLHQVSNSTATNHSRSESRSSNQSSGSVLMSFIQMLRSSLTTHGKLVIVHREPSINTLPLPVEVLSSWFDASAHSARLIEQLHRDRKKNTELLWEVETIKFVVHKLNWFSLLFNRTFYPLTLNSQTQIADGLRQLNETYFKYHQGLLEMYDRLLFITVQNKVAPPAVRLPPSLVQASKKQAIPSISSTNNGRLTRLQRQPLAPPTGPHEALDYRMLVTDEITELLHLQENRKEKKRTLFESSIKFM